MRWTEEEYQAFVNKKKGVVTKAKKHKKPKQTKNKYGNKKTMIDGIDFDSKKEARRYQELKLLEKAGVIKDLELQPKFLLQEEFEKNDKKHLKIEYIADFKYFNTETKQTVIEDVKGSKTFKTEVYRIKKKLFEYKYPELTIKEIY